MLFDYDKLRDEVRSAAQTKGVKLRDVAIACGLVPETLSRFLGGRGLDLETACSLTQWLGRSLSEFVKWSSTGHQETQRRLSEMQVASHLGQLGLDSKARDALLALIRALQASKSRTI